MLSRLQTLLSKFAVTRVGTDTSPGNMYSLSRSQTLAADREIMAAFGPFPEVSPDAPAWGVVMEMAYPGFSATLAAFSNGYTNFYTSDGRGVRNADNEQVEQAVAKLIDAANKAIPHLKPSASHALPAPWRVHIYVRTDSGDLVTEATGADFRNEHHPLFSLFTAASDVLMQVKLVGAERDKDYPRQCIAGLTKTIGQNPKAEDYARRASYYGELGEFDKALADLETVISLTPTADAFVGQGYMYMNMGDLTSALAAFNHAIEMEPTNVMAYSNRGIVYSKLQDLEKAVANYDVAIQHNPDYATAYINRSFAYYRMGRYKDGISDCNRALELRPDQPNAVNNRGLCRAALGDKEGARADFQRVLEHDPKPPADVIEESLTGLHALDYPGEPLPSVWAIKSGD